MSLFVEHSSPAPSPQEAMISREYTVLRLKQYFGVLKCVAIGYNDEAIFVFRFAPVFLVPFWRTLGQCQALPDLN